MSKKEGKKQEMEAKKGRRRGGVKRGGKGDFNRREVDQAYKSLGEVFDSKLGGAEKEEIEAKAFFFCCTVVQINQESRLQYWVTRSSVCSFTRSLALHC